MSDFLADVKHEFVRHKNMADRAMAPLSDEEFSRRPGTLVNPVAVIVKHLAGNLVSRWTDFLTADGEKASRDRDGEFVLTEQDTRANLLAAWEKGWKTLLDTLASLTDADLDKQITIRGEGQSVRQALLRGSSHVAYHTGQITYLSRWMRPDSPWLTIAPGQSKGVLGGYRQASK
jgi:uncharacterized damage-inducible protein DinB